MKKILVVFCMVLFFSSFAHAGGIWGGGGGTGSGDVTGPSSVTADGNVAFFSGTGGKTLKDGGAPPWSTCVGTTDCYLGVTKNSGTPAPPANTTTGYFVFGNTGLPYYYYNSTLTALLYSGGPLGTPASGNGTNLTNVPVGVVTSGLTIDTLYYRSSTSAWTAASSAAGASRAHCFAASATYCITSGQITWTSHGFSAGDLYLTTAGGLTSTPPGAGSILQKVGWVYDANTLMINVSPDFLNQ